MDRDSNGDLHLKAINKTYFNIQETDLPIGTDIEPVYVEWDLADDNNVIVVPAMVTSAVSNTKAELDSSIDEVVKNYKGSA